MKNRDYLKNVTTKKEALICKCGSETTIYHVSNWHDGTGLFYTCCEKCNNKFNVSWKHK